MSDNFGFCKKSLANNSAVAVTCYEFMNQNNKNTDIPISITHSATTSESSLLDEITKCRRTNIPSIWKNFENPEYQIVYLDFDGEKTRYDNNALGINIDEYGLPVWARENNGSMTPGWLGALVNTWDDGKALKGSTAAEINAKNYRYELIGVADFNGDGRDDVMLRNSMPTSIGGKTITGSGDVFTFLTGSRNAVITGAPPAVAYAGCATGGWKIVGLGDFNNDGTDDVLLSDGNHLAGWKMRNGQRSGDFWFGTLSENLSVAGVADFNNDGTDDILLCDSITAELSAWKIQNGTVVGITAIV